MAQSHLPNEDPEGLLQYDPAAIVIRASASSDKETLERLREFAKRLTHYLEMTTPPDYSLHFEEVKQEVTDEVNEETFFAGDAPEHEETPGGMAREYNFDDIEAPLSSVACSRTTEPITTNASVYSQSKTRIRVKREAKKNSKERFATRQQEYLKKASLVTPDRMGNGTLDYPLDLTDDEPSPKRRRKQKQGSRKQKVLPSYNGSLEHSQLPRSVGHTRALLNEHLSGLGLKAKFGQSVVSKCGTKMSHLTFHSSWNRAPYDEDDALEYWVGKGPNRLKLAEPLNPSLYPNQEAIPIFWAIPRKGGYGGSLCHYIGHFRCNYFEKCQDVTKMGKVRNALITFEYVRFDKALARKLSKLEA